MCSGYVARWCPNLISIGRIYRGMALFWLRMAVESQWASNQKFIQSRTPKIAEAGFVERSIVLPGGVYRSGYFDQITIQQPAPADSPLAAASYVRPLFGSEIVREVYRWLSGRRKRLSGSNQSGAHHDGTFIGIVRWGLEIVRRLSTFQLHFETDNLGWCPALICKNHLEHLTRPSNMIYLNEHPRPFSVNDGFGVQQSSIGRTLLQGKAISHRLSGLSSFFRLPPNSVECTAGNQDAPDSDSNQGPIGHHRRNDPFAPIRLLRLIIGTVLFFGGAWPRKSGIFWSSSPSGLWRLSGQLLTIVLIGIGLICLFWDRLRDDGQQSENEPYLHSGERKFKLGHYPSSG
jgi:hypothetical protein